MINNVSLTGRLTREPELRFTSGQNIPVLSFNLAVDRRFTNQQGERDADFISCVAWRKTAETMANHLNKGSLIGIEGHIQTRNYEHNDGYTVYVTEVVVDNFSFLESKNQASEGSQGQSRGNAQGNYQSGSQSNFRGNEVDYTRDPFDDNFEIDDDDLPF